MKRWAHEFSPGKVDHERKSRFSDIEMLHDILLEWCSNKNVHPDSVEAREVARELADLFDIGVRDYDALHDAIASR